MLVLIAESKTMETKEIEVSATTYLAHRPAGEDDASEIMTNISDMSVAEIVKATKLSVSMAGRLRKMAYEFRDKNTGLEAIEAFTGVVFQNLDYASLSPEEKTFGYSHIRIISSLYGWLRPEDIIKPYRLEYTSPLSPDDSPLWKYWRGKVTIELVHMLQARGETEILDLLPADAAKCIDWKLVKRFAKVCKVDFLEQNGEAVKSPHAGRLKTLRGKLLRHIILNRLTTVGQVASTVTEFLIPLPDYPLSDRLAFLT